MQQLRSFIIFSITLVITILLNISIGKLPPLAKFLDPFQGFWQNAEAKLVALPKNLHLPQLKEPVQVVFDEHLIPHIEATNDYDLYFIQGYVSAFHRLWQMEFHTHAAAGRLSEILGPLAIKYDRLQRRKGMLYAAHNQLNNILTDSVTNLIVHAYVDGVNAYIKSLDYKSLPIEYKLLDYCPEPWTALKTALVGLQIADELNGYDASLHHAQAYHILGEEKFDFLYPEYDISKEPVIPNNTPWHFKGLSPGFSLIRPNVTKVVHEVKKKLLHQVPKVTENIPPKEPSSSIAPINGSNNWALSGKKTVTGAPYLANDPHLKLRLPSIWYFVHLKTADVNVAGASLPGAPGVLIGFNESIAWGVTNAAWNVRDWYHIQFKDNERKEYYYDSLLLKTQPLVEKIMVKNAPIVYDTVLYTHLGPVVYDDNFEDSLYVKDIAMKWTGHLPGNEIKAFYLLNRGKNLQDFEGALIYHYVPAQNFAFAAINNDIAIEIAGKLPAKWKDQGKFIMPGNLSVYEWQSYIPSQHYPKIINPKQGFISSANERATDKSYPYYYSQLYEENYRNRRINQVLMNCNKADEKAMMRLQNDNYNLAAQENLLFLLSYLDKVSLDEIESRFVQQLKDWNYLQEPDQIAPSVFETWKEQLMYNLWSNLRINHYAIITPNYYQTMYLLKHHTADLVSNLGAYKTIDNLIVLSFKQAIEQLHGWEIVHQKPCKWSDYRPVHIPHLMTGLNGFGISHIRIGGGEGIINANQGSHGVSMRLIVSLDKFPKAWFIYPGGQPGNPGHPYYTKFIQDWSAGKYVTLHLQMPTQGENITCLPVSKITLK